MHRSRTIVPLAVLVVSLWSVAALAQSPAADAPAPPDTARDSDMSSDTADEAKAPATAPRREERGPHLTELDELVVEADKPLSAASSQVIRTRDYALRPHSTTQEILNNVPGLTVVQHQGGGKAVQYLIRGFDADHGTDFALFTDGIPVNMVTHAHGQGYADLNYLIPETVNDLQLFKGPYFVQLGDFSLAGALKITTKDEFKENFALAEGGSFDTQRYVLGGSVPVTWGKTLLAAEVYNSNGPFENPQNYWRYNGFGKITITQTPDQKLQFLGSAYSGDWDGSGQIPSRIVGNQPGDINRFGSLDPSEGGHSDRENASMLWSYTPSDDETWEAQLWGSRYHLRLYSDFSFFQNTGLRFYTQPGSAQIIDRCAGLGPGCPESPSASIPNAQFIPGDGIEQTDTRLLFGGFVKYSRFYSAAAMPLLGDVPMQSELAVSDAPRSDRRVAAQPGAAQPVLHHQRRRRRRAVGQRLVGPADLPHRVGPPRGRRARRRLLLQRRQPAAAAGPRSELRCRGDRRHQRQRAAQPQGQPGARPLVRHRVLPQLRLRLSLQRCAQRRSSPAPTAWRRVTATKPACARASSIDSTSRHRSGCSISTASWSSPATPATSTPI